jgi:hydroxymethylpyrimidine/phosphomethylpyrimidine kinase
LLKPGAIRLLKERLLPLAALVTPNLDEAEILVGRKLQSLADLEAAAREIHRVYGCAALVKGGHLRSLPSATDVFFDGRKMLRLVAPFVRGVSTHGTGCTYSAAITAFLARGRTLTGAVVAAKRYTTSAIQRSYHAGRHTVLQHGPAGR